MVKKLIVGLMVLLFVTIGVFASYVVTADGDVSTDKVAKYVYGSGEVSESTLSRYKAHCASLGGRFNTCGSLCREGDVCATVCAYTCDGVSSQRNSDAVSDIVNEESKVIVDYRTDENGYTIKYEGNVKYSEVDTAVEIKRIHDGDVVVGTSDGSEITVKIRPDQAMTRAFGEEAEAIDIKLEEKTYNNVPAVVYKLESEHSGRFLGLFKIRARYDATVDAETGDVLEWNGPWWAFMITADGDSREPTRPVIVDKVEYVEGDSVDKSKYMDRMLKAFDSYVNKKPGYIAFSFDKDITKEQAIEILSEYGLELENGETCSQTAGPAGLGPKQCYPTDSWTENIKVAQVKVPVGQEREYAEKIVGQEPKVLFAEPVGIASVDGRPTTNEAYSSRDLTPEECLEIGGTRETKCIGGDGPCMTYCDLSDVENAEEKCININGRLSKSPDGVVCTIFWKMKQVTDFESCVVAGNSVMESYPRQCRHGDVTFVEII